ncbi:MAG: low molecular weight phosphatase family protein [Nanoarchaeota archaeon]|nr:low molecular weight phosphatase family protein [Nanoarchaeota archaeon]
MIKILFVCTGNVFRSMTAEKCLKKYLEENNILNIKANSAGTDLIPQEPNPYTIERLKFYNIEVNHIPKWITQNLIETNDLIIAMNFNHQKHIEEKFKIKVPLFNEVAYEKSEGVLDFHEYKPDIKEIENSEEEFKKFAYYTVDYIRSAIPEIIKNLPNFIKNH